MSESSGEQKRKSVTRKQLYIVLALIGAVTGFAVSAAIALKTPVPEETITASYDSNITYEPTSPASEQPVDIGLNQSKDRNNSASLDEASESEDNNTDADEVTEEAPEEECETPVAGSEYVVIVEIRHCEFAYFELDGYGDPKEITREEATRQRVEDNSDTVDWAPTPPSDNASGSSDSNNHDSATEPEPAEPEDPTSIVDDYEDTYEASIMCPVERSENPEVYDACREGFVMPTSITSTGIQSCTVTEEGRVKGTIGYTLNGGHFSGADWSRNGSNRNGSKLFNVGGLDQTSGKVMIDNFGITVYFWSMDERYEGIIAEKTYIGSAYGDVSQCF